MKNINRVFGFILAFVTFGSICECGSFKNLRNDMTLGAGKGIGFRFSDPGFSFEDLLTKCGGSIKKLEFSLKRYFLDLYQGSIDNYEQESGACRLAMKDIKEKLLRDKVKKNQSSLWNNLFSNFIEPIGLAISRFDRVSIYIHNGEQVPEIIWGNSFKKQAQQALRCQYEVVKKNEDASAFGPIGSLGRRSDFEERLDALDGQLELQKRAEYAQYGLSYGSLMKLFLLQPIELLQMIDDFVEEFNLVKAIVEKKVKQKVC